MDQIVEGLGIGTGCVTGKVLSLHTENLIGPIGAQRWGQTLHPLTYQNCTAFLPFGGGHLSGLAQYLKGHLLYGPFLHLGIYPYSSHLFPPSVVILPSLPP